MVSGRIPRRVSMPHSPRRGIMLKIDKVRPLGLVNLFAMRGTAMSVSDSSDIDGLLHQLRTWSPSDRIRLARRILEPLEGDVPEAPARSRPLKDLLGLLKTPDRPPGDEECQAILEEEL